MVYETKHDEAETEEGFGLYEVFYEATVNSQDIWELVDALQSEEAVASAEPDFIWTKTTEGTYIEATAEEIANETHFPAVDAQNIWSDLKTDHILPGQDVVVAVIDTGVDYTHRDLAANMWVNTGEIPGNHIDDDGNGYVDDVYGYDFVENDGDPMDDHGHGTHVAGIIAMTPGNGGGVGLAYGAKIMAVKAGQSTGSFASTDIAKAIRYAVNNGADVINMSFGGTGRSYLVESALKDALATCVPVAAAGNNGLPTTDATAYGYVGLVEDIYPGGYNYVLGVMATDNYGNFASFSNWDFIVGANCEYEMAAPGVSIYSTLPNNRYAYWSGTSMATPNVAAAAAIIRSVHPDKSKYTSRYIMGQLVSATRDVTYNVANGRLFTYPLLNLRDSLQLQPKPKPAFSEIYLFDTEDISETNNNDGIVQPGEVIDLGVSLFNYWGTATDVTVTADAISDGGVPNPYVEWITDTVSLPEIGTFSTSSNGFVYDDTKLVGCSSPLRFRIKEGAPNDIQIAINLHCTVKNGMDNKDTTVYSCDYTYIFIVQNGEKLSGVIHEDMTLTADKYWILENNVLIPDGVTVTVEPGTQIQFWSADPSNPYGVDADVYLQVEGRFICEGTEDKPISLFPGKDYENFTVTLTCDDIYKMIDDDHDHAYTSLKYTNILNGMSKEQYGVVKTRNYFIVTEIDHCRMIYDINRNIDGSNYSPYSSSMNHTIVENYTGIWGLRCYGFCINGYHSSVQENLFSNSNMGSGITNSFMNNVLLNCQKSADKQSSLIYSTNETLTDNNGQRWYIYNQEAKEYTRDTDKTHTEYHVFESETADSFRDSVIGITWYLEDAETRTYRTETIYEFRKFDFANTNNAYLSNFNLTDTKDMRIVGTDEGHDTYDISGNYWGTTDPQLVKLQCYDADWNVSLNDLIQEPYLTLEDDMSAIYPFVTEAYLTDADGNRIRTANSGQTVTLHVCFNRDMAQDIQPMVTYGGASPYTDYLVNGSWSTMREWSAELKIDPFIDLGKMYIRVKDAVADDDRWLKTGTDAARFFFNIEKSAAQSMALQGTGFSGSNELTWLQDDYETLAGYNLYRSTSYDSTQPVTSQSFRKVNTSLIADTECAYSDTAVEQGVDYYYYFTVVDTDFHESPASNVVMCTPIDTEKPVITHTPITAAVAGEQIAMNATVTDNVKVESVTLYYRTAGSDSWKNTTMRKISDNQANTYRAVISAYEVTDSATAYYLTASDGTNTAFFGTAESPYIIAASNSHRYDEGTITKQPTCSAEGAITYTCLDCGKTRTEVLPKTEHLFNKGIITEMNSCTESGTKVYTCLRCGVTKTEVLHATGHNYADIIIEPTCQHQGYTEHRCLNCGDTHRDSFTTVTGHHYVEETLEPAKCLSNGLVVYTCTDCSESYTKILRATGHQYHEHIVAPTCQTQGYTEHTCEQCGVAYRDSFTKTTGHHWDEGVITAAPTVLSSGIKLYTCEDCGASTAEILSPLPMEPLTNCSVLSGDTVTAGDELLLHAGAEGGSGQYKYAVVYKDSQSDEWTTLRKLSANEMVYFTPSIPGITTLCLTIQDSFGNSLKQYYEITVEPGTPPVNTSTLSDASILLGRSVTIEAAAEGGVGDYRFAVYYKKASAASWTKVSGYTAATVFQITPKAAVDYIVKVCVKDSSGTIVEKELPLKVEAAVLSNLSALSADQIHPGETVSVNCAAKGGSGTITYAVYYKKAASSSWTKVQGYTTNQTVAITPKGLGAYDILVKAKDATGQIVDKDFTLRVSGQLQNISTVSATSIKLGEKVKIRCLATGGTTPYQYAVYYKKATSAKWSTLHAYSTTNILTLKPAAAVDYDIRVNIKDSSEQIVSRSFTLCVTK